MRRRQKRRRFTVAGAPSLGPKGEGLKSIGRVFGKNSSSIFNQLTHMAVSDRRHAGAPG